MSKSRNNTINIFLSDKKLRKQIMGVKTDSLALEDVKNPDTDTIFALYKLMASPSETAEMHANYLAGNYGYGHAKQALYELIITKFATIRARYTHFMDNKNEIDDALAIGKQKAKKVATTVLQKVRTKVGY